MFKKVITGALVVVVLVSSNIVVYADTANPVLGVDKSIEADINMVVNSPKKNNNGEIIVLDNLLVSVQILENSSVTLNIYKEDSAKAEYVIWKTETIDKGEDARTFVKEYKDLAVGNYKMVFEAKGKKSKSLLFKVEKKEKEIQKLQEMPVVDVLNVFKK
ncbi:MAG: hypothetical protein ACOYVK_14120 [Bacillota bacterium]